MTLTPDLWSILLSVLPHWLPHGLVALVGLILGSLWLTRAPRPAALLLAGSLLQLLCMGGSISLMVLTFGGISGVGNFWNTQVQWVQYGLSFLASLGEAAIIAAVLIDRAPRFPPPHHEEAEPPSTP